MKKKEDILIGQRIKDIRSNLNMDQKTFASNLKATVSALSNWENGRNKPNDIMLRRIAQLGNVSVTYLLEGKFTHTDLANLKSNKKISFEDFKNSFEHDKQEALMTYFFNYLDGDTKYDSLEIDILKNTFDLLKLIKEHEEKEDIKAIATKQFLSSTLLALETYIHADKIKYLTPDFFAPIKQSFPNIEDFEDDNTTDS